MSDTALALLAFAGWSLILVVLLGVFRVGLVLSGKRAANSFSASGEDLSGLGKRLTRAHANCYENLPVAGVVMLYAIALDQTSLTDPLALVFIGARIAQTLVHLASTARPAVFIRLCFYSVQVAILGFWILRLAERI